MQRLISSIYLRGDGSAAHIKTRRSPTRNGVPKNMLKPSKPTYINPHTHVFEREHMSMPIDPLLEMLHG